MAIVAAANSNRLPRPASQSARDMRPPAAAISATAIPQHSDMPAIARRPGARVSCSIARQANAKAITAEVVCVKSGTVNDGPYGIGQPGVQVTCEASRKNPLAMPSDTDGRHQRRTGAETRMPRTENAISPPPTETRTRATSNHPAVGIPGAPITLT